MIVRDFHRHGLEYGVRILSSQIADELISAFALLNAEGFGRSVIVAVEIQLHRLDRNEHGTDIGKAVTPEVLNSQHFLLEIGLVQLEDAVPVDCYAVEHELVSGIQLEGNLQQIGGFNIPLKNTVPLVSKSILLGGQIEERGRAEG